MISTGYEKLKFVSHQLNITNVAKKYEDRKMSDIIIHIFIWHMFPSPCGVVVKMLDYDIIVNEFEIQSFYYFHFQPNTLGKRVNPFVPHPTMG